MNTMWSEEIQGIQTLFRSRALRFDDLFFGQYERLFALDGNSPLRILEIGCGPGALARSLRRWYPRAEFTAVDRDSNFIRFARENVSGVTFLEADAAALPFPEDSFDVTISYTVQEHIEPAAFWGEQRRVLRPGGVCLCLSARPGIVRVAPCLAETAEEAAFWAQIPEGENSFEAHQVRRYPMTEAELPAAMESCGFVKVTTGYAIVDLTPDDPKFPPDMAEAMIEAERFGALEAIASAHSEADSAVRSAVNVKYDRRLALYRAGQKQWDTQTSITMVLRGEKSY